MFESINNYDAYSVPFADAKLVKVNILNVFAYYHWLFGLHRLSKRRENY